MNMQIDPPVSFDMLFETCNVDRTTASSFDVKFAHTMDDLLQNLEFYCHKIGDHVLSPLCAFAYDSEHCMDAPEYMPAGSTRMRPDDVIAQVFAIRQ